MKKYKLIKYTPESDVSGVYLIRNKVNNKCYIGKSYTIFKRIREHINNSQNHNSNDYNYALSKAIRKYGLDNFEWKIIYKIKADDFSNADELLSKKEMQAIKAFNSYINQENSCGYNETHGGDGNRKYDFYSNKYDWIAKEFKNGITIFRLSKLANISEPEISQILKIRNIETKNNTKETDDLISKLYLEGKSIKKISEKLSCSICKVQKSLNRSGTATRKPKTRIISGAQPVEDSIISGSVIKDYLDGLSINKLAKKYRMGKDKIAATLKANSIIIRRTTNAPTKKVLEIDPTTKNVIATYDSTKAAAKAKGLKSSSSIVQICNKNYDKNKTAAGSVWAYIKEND